MIFFKKFFKTLSDKLKTVFSVARVGKRRRKSGDIFIRDNKPHCDLVGKIRICNGAAALRNKRRQSAVEAVIAPNRKLTALFHPDDTSGGKRYRSGMRVRSYKPASAEQDPAEIAGDNDNAVGNSRFFNNVENRSSRSSLRFAVVGITFDILSAQYIGVNVVFGVPVLCLDLIDKFRRLVLGGNRLCIADKTRTLYRKLIRAEFIDCKIAVRLYPSYQ